MWLINVYPDAHYGNLLLPSISKPSSIKFRTLLNYNKFSQQQIKGCVFPTSEIPRVAWGDSRPGPSIWGTPFRTNVGKYHPMALILLVIVSLPILKALVLGVNPSNIYFMVESDIRYWWI